MIHCIFNDLDIMEVANNEVIDQAVALDGAVLHSLI